MHGLDTDLVHGYNTATLPSETSAAWARPGRLVDLTTYRYFPGGVPPDEGSR